MASTLATQGDQMNDRQRFQAVLSGQPVDRMMWSPRLLLWYNARQLQGDMPERFRGMSLREVERALHCATPAREGSIMRMVQEDVEIVERVEEGKRIKEWHTPVGSVRNVTGYAHEMDAVGLPGRVEEFPLKTAADYRVWEWIVEHTTWVADYDAYAAYDADIGDEGLPMVSVGDVPLHEFMENLAGYNDGFFHLYDYPAETDHLLNLMWEVQRERLWPIILNSPAVFFLHGVHLSSQFTPPRYYTQYILPYYQEFAPLLHERGKKLAMHADNDVSHIAELLDQSGYDLMESFVSAPMVPFTIERARELWGNRIVLWGGLPSLLLSPSVPESEFRAYMDWLFAYITPGDAFVLGVSDNVMPDSLIERVAWVGEVIDERGR